MNNSHLFAFFWPNQGVMSVIFIPTFFKDKELFHRGRKTVYFPNKMKPGYIP